MSHVLWSTPLSSLRLVKMMSPSARASHVAFQPPCSSGLASIPDFFVGPEQWCISHPPSLEYHSLKMPTVLWSVDNNPLGDLTWQTPTLLSKGCWAKLTHGEGGSPLILFKQPMRRMSWWTKSQSLGSLYAPFRLGSWPHTSPREGEEPNWFAS